ncbi:hypothetical protein BJ138DRAFT_1156983 [Hygrophoropsis aurantiaca]|uniref:Uncharacterized protein n=1 Tax=Hygrophoropsis aurantiaca TaxID=72124 RepID=A0ACB8A694_9AGAM|nr:hypothetical protein BJ138DRAFT_1156983 [Hygrophoropsis aurantiaca]
MEVARRLAGICSTLSTTKRSVSHYYEDIFVVIKVESQLYRLPAALLRKRSRVFADLFSLPRENSVRHIEGLSDEHPIVLEGHSCCDFDCLLDFLFGSIHDDTDALNSSAERPSVSFLISVLKMCAVFDIHDGTSYAIAQLETHPLLDLATKLQICHHYNIAPWLAPAFRVLVSRPIQTLTETDIAKVPSKVLYTFLQVKHEIATHRLSLASVSPPAVNDLSCKAPLTCAHHWEVAWRDGPAEMLRHPDIYYTGRDILAQLESADLPQVCNLCRDLSVDNVKDSGALFLEDRFVEDRIIELINWLGDQ